MFFLLPTRNDITERMFEAEISQGELEIANRGW